MFFQFFFAESIRMYPNASECVKTGPKRPENVEKCRENVEKLREIVVVIGVRTYVVIKVTCCQRYLVFLKFSKSFLKVF